MLQAKGANYFPYCCLMDAEGNVLKKLRPTSLDVITDAIGFAQLRIELEKTAETDPAAKLRLKALEMFESDSPPSFKEANAIIAKSGLAESHPAIVKAGLENVKSAILQRINKDFGMRMRKVMNDEDRDAKFKAIDKERCAAMLAAHDEGLAFAADSRMAIPFYSAVTKGAAAAGRTDDAKKAFAIADKALAKMEKESTAQLESASGRMKSRIERRLGQIRSLREELAKAVAPPADG